MNGNQYTCQDGIAHKGNSTFLIGVAILFAVFGGILNANAQLKSQMKLSIETGPIILSDSENLSFFLNIEPKLKATENTLIGLRIGATINSQSIQNDNPDAFFIFDEADNGAISFVPTFDYRFSEGDFRPYLGIGLGYYLLASYVEVQELGPDNPRDELTDVQVDNKVGVLLRGGLEIGRLRLGAEYNFIPKADLKMPNGAKIGTVDNSYLALVVGYTIWGERLKP